MEFKFRAGDHRRPPPPPPLPQYPSSRPPTVYCFSKQGFPDGCLRRNANNVITVRKPFDAMQCEMELMRLREEKLLVEIDRQRFLKEEARRELILFEREMAIRGVARSAGYSFREQHRWEGPFSAAAAPSPVAVVQSFHELQKMEQLKSPTNGLRFGALALPPRVQPFMADDKKERQVLQADKRELIILEKPDPNVFAERPKVLRSTSTNDIPSFGVKKNPKDEWSCALCQVTVPSERTFNHHLNGKKHKRKEAGLMSQKANKSNEPLPNKKRKLLGAMETSFGSASAGSEVEKPEAGSETHKCEKTEGSFDLKLQNELVTEENLVSKDVVVGKKKFKFWCQKCEVGAYAMGVMSAHLNGKKHQASLQEVDQNQNGTAGGQQPL